MNNWVNVYVDGSCPRNPGGPGGWGVYLKRPDGKEMRLCGGSIETTNNRMELTAAIRALEVIKVLHQQFPTALFAICCDSQYVVNGATRWLDNWKRYKNWEANKANVDLWKALDVLRGEHVLWHWVKGHAGNPGNEEADRLAAIGRESQVPYRLVEAP